MAQHNSFDPDNDPKDMLLDALEELLGRPVHEMKPFLKALSHPDVIEKTKKYFDSIDPLHRCQNYEHPWNCAREAEARYENIKYGWLGGGSGVGYSEWWCEPCRTRVMEG